MSFLLIFHSIKCYQLLFRERRYPCFQVVLYRIRAVNLIGFSYLLQSSSAPSKHTQRKRIKGNRDLSHFFWIETIKTERSGKYLYQRVLSYQDLFHLYLQIHLRTLVDAYFSYFILALLLSVLQIYLCLFWLL